ncbi:Trans-enoyl reductase TOXD [Cladobotryum mycophilum]|uniref:Trans-enoyl reductase TOXD n=1 Tax=Cladobotryum mycophilum TaxID=491253 RepID=A0ABR0SN12_9HYPO
MATTQKAIVIQGNGSAKLVNDRPIPKLRDEYILVKTVAVALNPTDWKHIKGVTDAGPVVGCDYAGIVEEVGSAVTKDFKKGDRICGVTHGSNKVEHEDGSFAEYIVVKAALQIRIPDDISFEEAATFGVGITTVGFSLFQKLGLALPTEPIKEPVPILIYGGSSASGVLGIQFAKAAGYTVITTCSPRNNDFVKSLGADAVFDYSDPEVGSKIREHADNKLIYAWDTITNEGSAKICADALTSEAGGKYNSLTWVKFPREDVTASVTVAYTALGEAFTLGGYSFPPIPQDLEYASKFWDISQGLLKDGKIKAHQIRLGNGLEGVLDGLKEMEEGKVSGEKLVYKI